MAEQEKLKDKPGVAKLKPEFILVDHKPELDTEYVSAAVKEQIDNDNQSADGGPPSKRLKLKGRNKQRPKHKRMDQADKLCSAFLHEEKCNFGDKCKFSHDPKKFMENKLADIGAECHLFQTYGKCPYGIACRFAKTHITDDLKNIVKPEYDSLKKKDDTVSNELKKELQRHLWKRTYDFSKADSVLETICPYANDQKRRSYKPADSTKLLKDNKTDSDVKLINIDNTNSIGSADKPVGDHSNGDGDSKVAVDGTVPIATGGQLETTPQEKIGDVEMVTDKTDQSVDSGIKFENGRLDIPSSEPKKVDFANKLYLAPLTTVGNLPFRRVCKQYGADITCAEMAVCTNLLQGQQSEWALLKRHESEDLFGVQLCGGYPDSMTRCAQLVCENLDIDFIDINCGCPIDLIFNKGEGSALMGRSSKFEQIVKGMQSVMDVPLTVKIRTGIYDNKNIAHTLVPNLRDWGVALTTLHGRSRMQRYTKNADWDYINECATMAQPMPLFGNGDIMSYEEANLRREQTGVSGVMLARGALIKPWVFTEIKEQRHWDISSSERYDMLKDYVNYGFERWGSDQQGVENTRRFLLEWLSFLYRYIPVGLLDRVPQKINERPPYYHGRNDLETLMASPNCGDWIKISEMLLGPVPDGFSFLPKHKANAYK